MTAFGASGALTFPVEFGYIGAYAPGVHGLRLPPAAVDAAEVGYRVVLVEREAYLGGRVVRMHRYFPKMCPPACGF